MSLSAMSRRNQAAGGAPPSSTTFRTYAGVGSTTTFNTPLGMRITVASGKKLIITHLGCYAADGALPASGVNVVTRVAASTATSTILATATFTSADTADLDATNRIILKSITPVELAAGTYGIWTYRESGSYRVYSSDGGTKLAVHNSITGVTMSSNGYYNLSNNDYPNDATGDEYGGSTWAGYTIDA